MGDARRSIALVVAMLGFAIDAAAEVTIVRKPAVVQRKTFDPAHPPTQMPPLHDGEAATTQASFECAISLSYAVASRERDGNSWRMSLRVRGVRAALGLKIVIWLPKDAPGRLVSHEEGHARISQQVYDKAERTARTIADALDGQVISGEGDNLQSAEREAVASSIRHLSQDYLDRTGKPAARINEIYDQITSHGLRGEPAEDEAIRQAFARFEKASDEKNETSN